MALDTEVRCQWELNTQCMFKAPCGSRFQFLDKAHSWRQQGGSSSSIPTIHMRVLKWVPGSWLAWRDPGICRYLWSEPGNERCLLLCFSNEMKHVKTKMTVLRRLQYEFFATWEFNKHESTRKILKHFSPWSPSAPCRPSLNEPADQALGSVCFVSNYTSRSFCLPTHQIIMQKDTPLWGFWSHQQVYRWMSCACYTVSMGENDIRIWVLDFILLWHCPGWHDVPLISFQSYWKHLSSESLMMM